jgi:hypothetical protein
MCPGEITLYVNIQGDPATALLNISKMAAKLSVNNEFIKSSFLTALFQL